MSCLHRGRSASTASTPKKTRSITGRLGLPPSRPHRNRRVAPCARVPGNEPSAEVLSLQPPRRPPGPPARRAGSIPPRDRGGEGGIEPATQLSPSTRFPVALLRPLGHLSAAAMVSRFGIRRALLASGASAGARRTARSPRSSGTTARAGPARRPGSRSSRCRSSRAGRAAGADRRPGARRRRGRRAPAVARARRPHAPALARARRGRLLRDVLLRVGHPLLSRPASVRARRPGARAGRARPVRVLARLGAAPARARGSCSRSAASPSPGSSAGGA